MEIFKAHQQWANRPEDERFTSLRSLYEATKAYADIAKEKNVPFASLRVEAIDDDVQLVGRLGVPAKLTHWAFGQLCSRMEAPASYLRELPATLACQNLNHGLARRVADASNNPNASLLFHANGSLLLRALTTDSYTRIWNHEVAARLMDLESQGWQPARPDIRVVDDRLPLYASDHDMFAFLSNRNVTVNEAGGGAMYRGVIVENSEVGASALKLTRFLYREMCGNHIIWGASKVLDISVRHVGGARQRWDMYAAQMRQYAESSASLEEAKIAKAQKSTLGASKSDVLDLLFSKRSLGLSRKVLEAGYDMVNVAEDGERNTQWGIVQGLTRYSQTIPFADKRTAIDEAAGRIMEFDF